MARFASVPEGCEAAELRGANTPSLLKTHLPVDALVFSPQASTSTLDGMVDVVEPI